MSEIDHSQRAHAPYAPSGAERWWNCFYAVDPENPAPDRPSGPANRGTALHEHSEKHLDAWTDPAEDNTVLMYFDPDKDELVAMEPEEWHPHVVDYVYWVRELMDEADLLGDYVAEKEQRVKIYKDLCFGSADHYIAMIGEELHITDLKGGMGHMVYADSKQLKLYAVGVCERFDWNFKRAYLHIAQAANASTGGRHTVELEIEELKAFHKEVVKKIQSNQRTLKKGKLPTQENVGDWCSMCPRLPTCPAHHKAALEAVGVDPSADLPKTLIVPDSGELSEQRFAFLLAHADQIEGLVKKVRAEGKARLLAGEDVPGFKLVRGKANRRWKANMSEDERVDAVLEVAKSKKKDLSRDDIVRTTTEVLPFSKIERKLGSGSLDDLLEKPEGRPTMAPVSDPRPAIDDKETHKQFEDESDLPPEKASAADLFEDESDLL